MCLMEKSNKYQFYSLWLDLTGDRPQQSLTLEMSNYDNYYTTNAMCEISREYCINIVIIIMDYHISFLELGGAIVVVIVW